MRIAILCSGRVAIPALDHLTKKGMVVAVGMPEKITETQVVVRNRCKQDGLPFHLFNKSNLHDSLLDWLHTHKPDVVFVKTFPFLIPAPVLSIPKYGFINFHYAPLPAWRGANPLFWMLRNGEKETAITIHQMSGSYDSGDVLLEARVPIADKINYGILYTQLGYAGMELSSRLIEQLCTGTVQKRKQDHSKAKWYGHPKLADLFINWQAMTAEEISGLIRACNPWHKGAAVRWRGWTFGISYGSVINNSVKAEPGTILSLDTNMGFIIACKNEKALVVEIVYCEEGFYPGYFMSAFGLQKGNVLE